MDDETFREIERTTAMRDAMEAEAAERAREAAPSVLPSAEAERVREFLADGIAKSPRARNDAWLYGIHNQLRRGDDPVRVALASILALAEDRERLLKLAAEAATNAPLRPIKIATAKGGGP